MDKAAKARQRAHQTRRQNEKRKQKQKIKEASQAYHYAEPAPRYRSFVPPMGGPEISIAAAALLFPRILR